MRRILLPLTALILGGAARAGTFVDDYESYANGAVSLTPPPGGKTAVCASNIAVGGTASCSAQTSATGVKYLRLSSVAAPTTGSLGSYKLPDLDPGLEVAEFTVEFDVRIHSPSNTPADGFSLNFGALL